MNLIDCGKTVFTLKPANLVLGVHSLSENTKVIFSRILDQYPKRDLYRLENGCNKLISVVSSALGFEQQDLY